MSEAEQNANGMSQSVRESIITLRGILFKTNAMCIGIDEIQQDFHIVRDGDADKILTGGHAATRHGPGFSDQFME
jgi:hypothetical protein